MTTENQLMKIGEFSRQTGKTKRTLHFYEELGLIEPAGRTPGGFRLYSDQTLQRITWIEQLQGLGFSLPEVADFLSSLTQEESAPLSRERLREFYELKIHEVTERLQGLRALQADLREAISYLDECRGCSAITAHAQCSGCQEHQSQHTPGMVAAVYPTHSFPSSETPCQ